MNGLRFIGSSLGRAGHKRRSPRSSVEPQHGDPAVVAAGGSSLSAGGERLAARSPQGDYRLPVGSGSEGAAVFWGSHPPILPRIGVVIFVRLEIYGSGGRGFESLWARQRKPARDKTRPKEVLLCAPAAKRSVVVHQLLFAYRRTLLTIMCVVLVSRTCRSSGRRYPQSRRTWQFSRKRRGVEACRSERS